MKRKKAKLTDVSKVNYKWNREKTKRVKRKRKKKKEKISSMNCK